MFSQRQPRRLIPVLDVMNGQVVRGVGGVRENYQPIVCPVTGSRKANEIASALLRRTRANELYIADLDAIMGRAAVSRAVQRIVEENSVATWIDAGIGQKLGIADLPTLPHLCPVVGSETCGSLEVLRTAITEARNRPIAFSIDLKNGRLLGDWLNWGLESEYDVLRLARRAIELNVRTLIVLDLARRHRNRDGHGAALARDSRRVPRRRSDRGGGVRTWADVEQPG